MHIVLKEDSEMIDEVVVVGYGSQKKVNVTGAVGMVNSCLLYTSGTPVFKAGVAVAAPTDWKYYDTVYTERFMLSLIHICTFSIQIGSISI